MHTLEDVNKDRLPQHVAIIMDGNGRWAKQRGKLRVFGHENGVESVRQTVESCAKLQIPFLTLYAFSTENWNRPKVEVDTLMRLLVTALKGINVIKIVSEIGKACVKIRREGRSEFMQIIFHKVDFQTQRGF